MKTATITIGSIDKEVEASFTVEEGQAGSYETESIPAHIYGVDKVQKLTHHGWVELDMDTLIALGLLEEIYEILNEQLTNGDL